jgi:hypothetical protein
MAKIKLSPQMLGSFLKRCPNCAEEINEFLTILQDTTSLDPDPFVEIGIVRVHNHIQYGPGGLLKRHRRYQLRLSGGHIGFYWKKANVEHISVDC